MRYADLPRGTKLNAVEHAVEREALHAIHFDARLSASVLTAFAERLTERAAGIDASTAEVARAHSDSDWAWREAPLAACKDDFEYFAFQLTDLAYNVVGLANRLDSYLARDEEEDDT